jgi:hypothetical protein
MCYTERSSAECALLRPLYPTWHAHCGVSRYLGPFSIAPRWPTRCYKAQRAYSIFSSQSAQMAPGVVLARASISYGLQAGPSLATLRASIAEPWIPTISPRVQRGLAAPARRFCLHLAEAFTCARLNRILLSANMRDSRIYACQI